MPATSTPRLCQNLGPGELRRRLLADFAERFEPTVRAGAARMDDPLGNALATEDFLDELIILQRRRTALAHAPQALVIGNRMTLVRRQCFTITEDSQQSRGNE